MEWIWIMAGGATGAALRHATVLTLARPNGGLPLGTLVVNGVGCAIAGLVLAWLTVRAGDAAWRPFLQVGLLGSLTTFSAFSVETLRLFESGAIGLGVANVALNVGVSLLAVTIGYLTLRAVLA